MYRWVPSQRRTTKPGERDSPARVTRQRDFEYLSDIPPCRGAGFPRRGHRGAGFSTGRDSPAGPGPPPGSPAGVTGERNFPLPGLREAGFSFPAVSESSLAFQRSCVSLGPFTEKDDEARGAGFPRQGHQTAGFSEAGFSILPGSGIPPPGSPGSGIFDRAGFPRRAGSPPAGVPCRGLNRESCLAFQRSCVSLGPFTEKDDEARGAGFPRQGHQTAGFSEAGFSIWERDLLFGNSPLPGSGIPPPGVTGERDLRLGPPPGSPAGVTGERNFPLPGLREAGFSFPAVSKSSLAFQRSCVSLGPFTEKDDEARGAGLPRRGRWGAEFSPGEGCGKRVFLSGSRSSEIPPCRERDSPAGVTGERDFRSGPPPGFLGSGILLRRGRGKRVFRSESGNRSSEIPPRRERDCPAKVTGERDFRPGPPT